MSTDRRTFLRLLASAALSQTFDLDKALWVPGARTWFLPSPGPSCGVAPVDVVFGVEYTFTEHDRHLIEPDWAAAIDGMAKRMADHVDAQILEMYRLKVGDTFTIKGVYA